MLCLIACFVFLPIYVTIRCQLSKPRRSQRCLMDWRV
jgi:hypothetical protein